MNTSENPHASLATTIGNAIGGRREVTRTSDGASGDSSGLERDGILTMREVADYLGVSRQMIYLLLTRDPSFQTFKVGAARRMRRSTLERWVHQQEAGRHDR